MDIQRPVFLKLWPRNVAVISNNYVAVISDKYVADSVKTEKDEGLKLRHLSRLFRVHYPSSLSYLLWLLSSLVIYTLYSQNAHLYFIFPLYS